MTIVFCVQMDWYLVVCFLCSVVWLHSLWCLDWPVQFKFKFRLAFRWLLCLDLGWPGPPVWSDRVAGAFLDTIRVQNEFSGTKFLMH